MRSARGARSPELAVPLVLLSAAVPVVLFELWVLRWRSHGSLARLYWGSFGEFRSTRVSVCTGAGAGAAAGAAIGAVDDVDVVDVVLVVMLGFVPLASPCGATAGWVMSVLSGEVPAVGLAAFGRAALGSVAVELLWVESADHGLVELEELLAVSVAAMVEDVDELE